MDIHWLELKARKRKAMKSNLKTALDYLPSQILFEGNYYYLIISRFSNKWCIYYKGVFKTEQEVFYTEHENIYFLASAAYAKVELYAIF